MKTPRRTGRAPGRRGASGFTLLEVLLAFVVFAISFATVLEIVAASTRSTVRARDFSEAALFAQSLAERLGTEFPVEVGSWSGESETGIAWTIVVSDFEGLEDDPRSLELADAIGTRLYWVDMTLAWGDDGRRREKTFTTLRSVVGGAP